MMRREESFSADQAKIGLCRIQLRYQCFTSRPWKRKASLLSLERLRRLGV